MKGKNKWCYLHWMKYSFTIKRTNQWKVNLKKKKKKKSYPECKNPGPEDYILDDSIYVKVYNTQTNGWQQNAHQWLLEVEGESTLAWQEGVLEVMDIFCNLIWEVVTEVFVFVKTSWTVYLKWKHLIANYNSIKWFKIFKKMPLRGFLSHSE